MEMSVCLVVHEKMFSDKYRHNQSLASDLARGQSLVHSNYFPCQQVFCKACSWLYSDNDLRCISMLFDINRTKRHKYLIQIKLLNV